MKIPQEEQSWINSFIQDIRSELPDYIADSLCMIGVREVFDGIEHPSFCNQNEWNTFVIGLIPDHLRPAIKAFIMMDLCGPDGICGPEYGQSYLRDWSRWVLTQL